MLPSRLAVIESNNERNKTVVFKNENYEYYVIGTTLSVCNKLSFLKTTVLLRSLFDSITASLDGNITCPIIKNVLKI